MLVTTPKAVVIATWFEYNTPDFADVTSLREPVKTIYIVGLYLIACEVVEFLLLRMHDAEAFPPKIGFRILRWLGIAVCVEGISVSDKSLNWPVIFYAVFLVFWLYWPRTVLIDSSCVFSRSAFGLFRRSVLWPDVCQVSSDWQEEHFRFWTFTGYSITVWGRNGRKIEHGLVNKDQGRFLNALRRFVPREAFDAGLYDWHPDCSRSDAPNR